MDNAKLFCEETVNITHTFPFFLASYCLGGDFVNLYFVSFSLFALLITQVTLQFTLHFGKKHRHRFRLLIGGIPVFQYDSSVPHPFFQKHADRSFLDAVRSDVQTFRILTSPLMRKRLSFALKWVRFSLVWHIAFEDACVTILTYQALLTLCHTLSTIGLMPSPIRTQFSYHFGHEGSQFDLDGIVTARLGSLALCALTFVNLQRQMLKKSNPSKEVSYATPH